MCGAFENDLLGRLGLIAFAAYLGGHFMESERQDLPLRSRAAGESVQMRSAGNAQLPPHPLDKRWYAHVDGKSYGPYTGHEIKQMVANDQLIGSDFLCVEGASAWTQAKDELLLGTLFRARPQSNAPHTNSVTAKGGTIVQITNNLPGANIAQAALLPNEGAAPKSPGVALLLSFLISGASPAHVFSSLFSLVVRDHAIFSFTPCT